MARYVRKLIAALLMVTALIVTQIPAVNVDAARVDVGDYTMDGDTLVKYNGTETSVTVPNSVRTIGHEAFSGNTTMTEVVIPDNVTNVDFSSFENCKNLQKVTMGSNVKSIGAAAFSGCTSLKSISIPAKTAEIGAGAFAKCSSLSNIPVDYQNQNYICESGVLYTQDQTQIIQYLAGKPSTSYTMPDTVEKIGAYAFWGAEQLTGVTISSGVKDIPEYAFDNCNGLSTVTIPGSVESLQAYSFGDCVNLSKIYIPKSVGFIDDLAFACSNNVNIQFTDGNGSPDGQPVQTVSGNAAGTGTVSGNTADKTQTDNSDPYSLYDTVDFSENVMPGELGSGKIVGGSVVVMMSSDQAVRGANMGLAESEDGIAGSGSHGTYSAGDYEILAGTLAEYLGSENDVALPVNVSRIGERAFYKNENLNTVTMPSRVTSIGDFAFARSGLSSVNIPEGVTDIGYAAFYHCNNLSDVTIPSTVSHIDLGAFEGTPWLNQWKSNGGDGNDFLIVGDGILLAYRGAGGDVVIPDGVKTIGAECFKGNGAVSQLTIPEGVTTIGEDACNGCSMLYSVNLPQSLIKLEDRAFADCPFQQVSIPQGVQEIGLGAFDATAIGSPMQTIILEGSTLPNVTYNTTATRLSGANLRKLALEGIGKVILRQDAEITSGSVLDPNYYGFRGLVYKMTGEPTDTAAGTLELQSCTILPNASTGQVSIDPHATVDGKEYIMTGVKASAFDPYHTVETWSGRRLTGIQIQGNASDSLKNLISQITFSDAGGAVNAARTAADSIFVYSTKAGMEDTSKISAVIPDSTDSYMLMISDGEDTAARVSQALSAQYSAIGGITSYPMEMQLYDALAMVPITKLATDKMEICMPIPALFTGTDGLEVGAVNANGTLDRLASEITDVGGTPCIRFVASHFSPYVIYRLPDTAAGGTASISKSVSTAAGGPAQYVVSTLTKGTGRIQPKWYIAGILALLSILLFCFKRKKRS
ncbi:MAG: leucine-rich repeat domain-containing protein [bacterium]|nr:leucine-rich repeat domain-containing protein [bacterium]